MTDSLLPKQITTVEDGLIELGVSLLSYLMTRKPPLIAYNPLNNKWQLIRVSIEGKVELLPIINQEIAIELIKHYQVMSQSKKEEKLGIVNPNN